MSTQNIGLSLQKKKHSITSNNKSGEEGRKYNLTFLTKLKHNFDNPQVNIKKIDKTFQN